MKRCSPPRRGHDLFAGPQGQMIGVAQDHFGAGAAELLDFQTLDAALGGDGHEGGQFHRAVRRDKGRRRAATGVGIGAAEMEGDTSVRGQGVQGATVDVGPVAVMLPDSILRAPASTRRGASGPAP